jgi:hypothetical protein
LANFNYQNFFDDVLAANGYLRVRRFKQRMSETQERARVIAGTSIIGSAIHVAGHPSLERNQKIVFALVDSDLKIYRYDDPHPIDVISVRELESVKTIVYDDDRIPHSEIIDSSAQALLIQFHRNGQEVDCLFRSMRKLRPIDWYHALQGARVEWVDTLG